MHDSVASKFGVVGSFCHNKGTLQHGLDMPGEIDCCYAITAPILRNSGLDINRQRLAMARVVTPAAAQIASTEVAT